MPGYGKKLNNEEMWQVVLYVRSLQKMDRPTNYEKRLIKRRK